MPIFKIEKGKLIKVRESSFKVEREIQSVTEKNIDMVFNIKFVRSEFGLNGLRVDTLAFDELTKSFVIIEYKKDRNFSVIDQGYAYLSLLLNNKADFVLEYNEKNSKNLKKSDVDWSQSKIIFISPSFSKYQRQAINFKDLPIELWEVSCYDNNTIQYLRLVSPSSSESINTVSKKSKIVQEVSKEVKVFSEEHHLLKASKGVSDLYYKLKQKIAEIDDNIVFNSQKYYISLRDNKNFAYIRMFKSHFYVVIMLPRKTGENLIKHHEIRRLSKGTQKFYSGPCFKTVVKDDNNLDEIIHSIEKAYENQK